MSATRNGWEVEKDGPKKRLQEKCSMYYHMTYTAVTTEQVRRGYNFKCINAAWYAEARRRMRTCHSCGGGDAAAAATPQATTLPLTSRSHRLIASRHKGHSASLPSTRPQGKVGNGKGTAVNKPAGGISVRQDTALENFRQFHSITLSSSRHASRQSARTSRWYSRPVALTAERHGQPPGTGHPQSSARTTHAHTTNT